MKISAKAKVQHSGKFTPHEDNPLYGIHKLPLHSNIDYSIILSVLLYVLLGSTSNTCGFKAIAVKCLCVFKLRIIIMYYAT